MRLSSLVPIVGVTLSACQPSGQPAPAERNAEDPAAARAAINQANERGARALNARDRAAYLAIYSDRVTIMSINAPDLLGRAALDSSLGAEWEAMKDSGVVVTWRADSIEVHGDYAYEVGRGQSVRPRNGGADTVRTRYITFWHREGDGSWRASRDFTVQLPRRP